MFPLCPLDQVVQVVDISLVVLTIVVIKGLRCDNLAECVLCIGEFGELECHFLQCQIC